MITFLYWATDIETKEKVNFADENLYEIGQVITRPDGSEVKIGHELGIRLCRTVSYT